MESLQSEDGQHFVQSLARFIRQHEKALANSLQLSVHRRNSSTTVTSPTTTGVSGLSSTKSAAPNASSSDGIAAALSNPWVFVRSLNIKAAHLTLTPHHLYYLLSQVEELDVDVGPMNVRMESIHADFSQSNYISFLEPRPPKRSDQDSIHSVSSMRSVVSTMADFWTKIISPGNSRSDKAKAQLEGDLKYLYSAFTKLPSLRLTADHRTPRIKGYEEFPFDTAVPLHSFKNLQQLDIVDLDFRSFHGWHRLAECLTFLTVKRAQLNDPTELLTDVVLDDAEDKRRRSTRGGLGSPTPTASWTVPSTPQAHYARSHSDPGTPVDASPKPNDTEYHKDGIVIATSASPKRPSPPRPSSTYRHARTYSSKVSRSGSGSSNSSETSTHPHRAGSSSDLAGLDMLPPSRWQRLKFLSLADNGLTHISAKSIAPVAGTLRSLNLSSNLFAEIPEGLSTLTQLTSLDLTNCMIESLQSLVKCPLPAITKLVLKSNRLQSLAGVEKLLSLEHINIQDNALSDPDEVRRLTSLPNLRSIWIKGNPFCKVHTGYRVKVFNIFRATPGYEEDIVIDNSGPGYAEKKQLIERVPEKEHKMSAGATLAPGPIVFQTGTEHAESSKHPTAELSKASSRRRRPHKGRKIVDLAHDQDVPWANDSAITPKSRPSVDSRRSTDGVVAGRTERSSKQRANIQQALKPTAKISGPNGESEDEDEDEDTSTTETQHEDFRLQAEALRRELGSGWLSALGEQSWHGSHQVDLQQLQQMQRMQAMGPLPGLHRANTLVPTSDRTLG